MFIGHFAVGFAAKRVAPRASLGALMAAPIFLDLLWPVFLILGLEQVRIEPGNTAFMPLNFVHYPISHSLLTSLSWATGFALLYHFRTRYWPGTLCTWFGVISHWVFDAIVHRPDLPLYPGGEMRIGLGLWNSIPATIVVEGTLFIIGVWLYAKQTRPMDNIGVYGFWSFAALLILLYLGNLFGPPPPSEKVLAFAALIIWLVIPWVWWFDRHRTIENNRATRKVSF
ncbi:MAG: hypothetical protein HY204_12190 [Nitrospirae bacterium]|nr:hypothetical protein [Nitrospirota bacterium]